MEKYSQLIDTECKRHIQSLGLKATEELGKEIRAAIDSHPYNCGQIVEMDEMDQLYELEAALDFLSAHEGGLRQRAQNGGLTR